jgi:hypothetical protein
MFVEELERGLATASLASKLTPHIYAWACLSLASAFKADRGSPGRTGSEAMMRFSIAIAAAVVLSLGGIAGYLLPLP